jgi:hypothetical protein
MIPSIQTLFPLPVVPSLAELQARQSLKEEHPLQSFADYRLPPASLLNKAEGDANIRRRCFRDF